MLKASKIIINFGSLYIYIIILNPNSDLICLPSHITSNGTASRVCKNVSGGSRQLTKNTSFGAFPVVQ